MATVSKFTPNPGLYTNEHHQIYLAESPLLAPGPEDCVVHVRCNGICGSDVHFWKAGAIGTIQVNNDYILGHEGSGVVVWAGDKVSNLQPGDRVAIEPGQPCGTCQECSTGIYNLCASVKFSGAPPYNGSIRRYHVHNAKFLHKMPANLTFADGALLEPLSVVLHAFERSPIMIGEPTVICGAGPIGLITLAVAYASGATPLVITDIDANRLKFAKRFVPGCETFLVPPEASPPDVASEVVSLLESIGGEPPRTVYECTGVQSSVVTAAYLPRPKGEVMVIGVGRPIMNDLPFMHMSLAEVDLKFINRYHHTWPRAIRILSSGRLDLKPLITHRFTLEDAVKALTSAADKDTFSVKIHIEDAYDHPDHSGSVANQTG